MEDLSRLMLANRFEATRWRASFRTAALGTWRRDAMRLRNALRRNVNLLFDLLVDEDDNDSDSPEKLIEDCDECHVIGSSYFFFCSLLSEKLQLDFCDSLHFSVLYIFDNETLQSLWIILWKFFNIVLFGVTRTVVRHLELRVVIL